MRLGITCVFCGGVTSSSASTAAPAKAPPLLKLRRMPWPSGRTTGSAAAVTAPGSETWCLPPRCQPAAPEAAFGEGRHTGDWALAATGAEARSVAAAPRLPPAGSASPSSPLQRE